MNASSPRRLWPVLSFLVASLLGLLGIEQYARERGNGRVVISIRQGSTSVGAEDGEPEVAAEAAPALSPAHTEARAAARRGEADRAIALYRAELEAHQGDPALRRELGATLMAAGRLEEAKAELSALAESQPKDPKVATLYGALLRRLGDQAGAEAQLRRAVELAPSNSEARVALGALLVRSKRWAEAMTVLEPSAKVGGNRDRANALYWIGRAHLGADAKAEAKVAFDEAVTWAPADAELRVRIGRAYLDRGGREANQIALSILEVATELAPDLADALRAYGRALEATNQDRAAQRAYERAVHLEPSDRYARIRLLRLALDRSDFVVAQSMAQYLVEQAPEVPEHQFLAGLVAARAGRLDAARASYLEAVERAHGEYPEAYFNLGLLEKRRGNLEAAISAYGKAVAQRPDYLAALNNLALTYGAAGRPAEAEKTLRRAIELSPKYAAAWLNLGEVLGDLGRNDEAINAYQEALKVKPDYPEAALDLGVAYARAQRLDDAIATYQKLLEARPRYVPAAYNLALALETKGDRPAAQEALKGVLAIDPEHAGSLAKLAQLEADGGSVEQAISTYQTLLEQQPNDRAARLTLAELYRRQGQADACKREAALGLADLAATERTTRLDTTCSPRPSDPRPQQRN